MKGNKYETVPKEVVAVQWFKEGDHPDVAISKLALINYRCGNCGNHFSESIHGQIYTNHGNANVCPGDHIVSDTNGNRVVRHEHFIVEFRKLG